MTEVDMVNRPPHYIGRNGIEAIDVVDGFFHDDPYLATIFTYIARCKHKGRLLEDLRKAKWYLDRKVQQVAEAESPTGHGTAPITGFRIFGGEPTRKTPEIGSCTGLSD